MIREMYPLLFTNYPDVVTVDQMRKMLNISKTAAYNLVKTKEIKSAKSGRKIILAKINIIAYILQDDKNMV